jgi:serine acetyltransferase
VVIGARAVVGDWAAVTDEAQPGLIPDGPIVVADGAVIGPHAVVSSSLPELAEVAPYAVV